MNFKNELLGGYLKRLVLVAICSIFAVGATAQSNDWKEYYKDRAVTNGFWANWFIQGGVGSSVYAGGQNEGSFGNRNTITFDLAVGKWITPTIGFRAQWNNSLARQYASVPRGPHALFGTAADGTYPQKFMYNSGHGDILWNMSAGIGGYKESRFYEIIPYLGFGVVRASEFETPTGVAKPLNNYEFAATAGIINKFRISSALDANIELRSTVMPSEFDGVAIGTGTMAKANAMMSATAGLTYRFGKVRNFKRVSDIVAMNPAPIVQKSNNDEVDRLKNALAKEQELNRKLQDQLRNQKPAEPKTIIESTPSSYSLFFDLGKTTLDSRNLVNLQKAAEMIKNNPSKTFRVETYADKKTGSAARNKVLTEKRAQYIYDQLIKEGVKSEQIVKVPNGSTTQPFTENDLNRVAIIMN